MFLFLMLLQLFLIHSYLFNPIFKLINLLSLLIQLLLQLRHNIFIFLLILFLLSYLFHLFLLGFLRYFLFLLLLRIYFLLQLLHSLFEGETVLDTLILGESDQISSQLPLLVDLALLLHNSDLQLLQLLLKL